VLTPKLRITAVCRAGNTIITGYIVRRILAVTIDTGIRGTAHSIITVGVTYTVQAPVTGFITHKGWRTGISTVLTACNGITGLCPITVRTVITGSITGLV
jgi:hypothetical protein